MRVALIFVLMLLVTTSSNASPSCMSKDEARKHFGPVHIYWHGPEHCWDASPSRRYHRIKRNQPSQTQHNQQSQQSQQSRSKKPKWQEAMSEMLPDDNAEQTSWISRWVDIETPPIISRWVDIIQVAPQPTARKTAWSVSELGMVVMVLLITVTMIISVMILFGGIRNARR